MEKNILSRADDTCIADGLEMLVGMPSALMICTVVMAMSRSSCDSSGNSASQWDLMQNVNDDLQINGCIVKIQNINSKIFQLWKLGPSDYVIPYIEKNFAPGLFTQFLPSPLTRGWIQNCAYYRKYKWLCYKIRDSTNSKLREKVSDSCRAKYDWENSKLYIVIT